MRTSWMVSFAVCVCVCVRERDSVCSNPSSCRYPRGTGKEEGESSVLRVATNLVFVN